MLTKPKQKVLLLAIVLITFILIVINYLLFFQHKEEPKIVSVEDVSLEISKNFEVNISSANFYLVRYKDTNFEIHTIVFSSSNDLENFLQKFVDYIQGNFTIEKTYFKNFNAYKTKSKTGNLLGYVLQGNNLVFLILGYTTNEKYLIEIINWLIK